MPFLEIALISKYNEKNKFILATSFENTDKLQCNLQSYNQYYKNNESATVLKYGLKIDEQYHLESIMMQSNFSNRWSDDYHSFVLSWTEEDVEFKIDGESTYVDAVWNLPLNIILDSEVRNLIIVMLQFLNFLITPHSVLHIRQCVSRRYK